MPMNGSRAKNTKKTKNKYLEIWNNFFWFIAEKVIKIKTPKIINNKCFIISDSQQKTHDSSISAIGDVTGDPMLAHKASH